MPNENSNIFPTTNIFEELGKIPLPPEAIKLPTEVIDWEKYEEEKELEIEAYQDLLSKYNKKIQQEFINKRKTEKKEVFDFDEDIIREIKRESLTYKKQLDIQKQKFYPSKYPTGTYKAYNPKHVKFLEDYVKFNNAKNAERFSKLTPEQKKMEIEVGGIDRINYGLESFMDGTYRGLFSGLLDEPRPIYGKAISEAYPKLYTAGNFLGNIISFIGLSKLASVAGVPKVLEALSKGKSIPSRVAAKAWNFLGKPKVWLDKNAILFKTAKNMLPKYGTGAAVLTKVGTLGATTGMIKSVTGTTQYLTDKYRQEDKMKKSDWLKIIPVALKSFFEGYGISVINEPRSWSIRLLGDALYSMYSQGADMLIHPEKEWDWNLYIKDMLLGHILGEIQGKIFSPSKKMRTLALGNRTINEFQKHLVDTGRVPDMKSAWLPADQVYRSMIDYTTKTGKNATGEQVEELINVFSSKKALGIKRSIEYPEAMEIPIEEYAKVSQEHVNLVTESLKKRMKLPKNIMDFFKLKNTIAKNNYKEFIDTLKSEGKIVKAKRVPEVELSPKERWTKIRPMNLGDFQKEVHGIVKEVMPELFKNIPKDVPAERRSELELFRTLDLLSPKEEAGITRAKEVIETDIEDPLRKQIYTIIEANKEAITKGLHNLETPGYTVEKAFEDFTSKQILNPRKEIVYKEGKPAEWTKSENGIKKYTSRSIRNLLINAKKRKGRIEEVSFIDTLLYKDVGEILDVEKPHELRLYRLLLAHTKRGQKRASLDRAITRYLHEVNNLRPREILKRFNELGIKTNIKKINKDLQTIKTDIKDMITTGKGLDIRTPVKDKYTIAEAKKIWEEEVTRKNIFNETTGLRKDLYQDPQAIKLIAKNNGYVFSSYKLWSQTALAYNPNVADKVIKRVAEIINNLVNEININYGERANMYIKNPVAAKNSKFILYQEGLTQKEFFNNINYVARVLKNNYSDDDFLKKFAITLNKTDGTHEFLTKFDVDVTKTKSVSDLVGEPANINNIDLPAWKEAKSDMENSLILREAEKGLEIIPKKSITQKHTEKHYERMEQPDTGTIFEKALVTPRDMSEESKTILDSAPMNRAWSLKIKEKLTGIKAFKSEIGKFMDDKFTIWEGLELEEQYMPIISAIERIAAMEEETGVNVISLLLDKNGVFWDEVTWARDNNKSQNLFLAQKIVKQIIEQEGNKIIKEGTLTPLIRAGALQEPINGLKPEIDLDKWRMKRIAPKEIMLIAEASSDPVARMKLMYQLYDIPGDVTINMVKKVLGEVMPVEKKLYQSGLPLGVIDQDFNVFEKIKNNRRKHVIDILKKYAKLDPEAPGFETIDFEKKGAREYLKGWLRTIPVEEIKNEGLRHLEFYYDTDIHTPYLHHVVIADPHARVRYEGQIEKALRGAVATGEKVVSPYMEEFTGRKYATIEQLVKDGQEVTQTGIFEDLWAELTYLKTKRENFNLFDSMKMIYMKEFIEAKKQGLLKNFFEEKGGYFYKPTSSEHERYKKTRNKLKSKKKSLEKMPQNTAVINKITAINEMISDIDERVSMMAEVIKTWKTDPNREDYARIVLENEQFVPLNQRAYEHDNFSIPELTEGITTRIKRNKIHASNIQYADGLFFNRIAYKGMQQFVFRNATINNAFNWSFLNGTMRTYRIYNSVLKTIRLVKPTIMLANDMAQGLIANPKFLFNLPFAWKAVKDSDMRDKTKEAIFVRDMNRKNLYNKSINPTAYMTDAMKAFYQNMDKGPILGKIMDDWAGEKHYVKKRWQFIKNVFKANQEFTWKLDKILRTAVAKTMNDRFIQVYGKDKGDLVTAEWANQHMVNYDRIPRVTRQFLNLFALFPTYRIGTLRLYKNMFKNLTKPLARAVGLEGIPDYKVKKNQWLFDIQPALLSFGYKTVFKTLMAQMFGYGFSNVFDAITGYRGKKRKGRDLWDSELQFFSLSTPLFEIEKHLTRGLRSFDVLLKYNMAAFPGLIWSWASNSNLITGKPIVTESWRKAPHKAFWQLTMDLLRTYFPLGSDMSNMFDKDIDLLKKIVNFSGIGYFYNYKSPKRLYELMEEALDKSKTIGEHKAALNKFNYSIRRAHRALFNDEFKDIADMIEKRKQQLYDVEL